MAEIKQETVSNNYMIIIVFYIYESFQPVEQIVETNTDDQSATNNKSSAEVKDNNAVEDKKDDAKNASTNSNANGGELQVSKLFVGRLPSGTKENQLKELFSTYGQVTHCDIVGKYGFVVCSVISGLNLS